MAATGLELVRGVLLDPSSNPSATFALIASISIAVLLALVLSLMALLRPRDRSGEVRCGAMKAGAPVGGSTDAGADVVTTASAADADDAEYEYPDLVPDDVVTEAPAHLGQSDAPYSGARHRGRPRRLGCGGIVAIVAFAALLAGMAATSTDAYCTRVCHAHGGAVAASALDSHAGVRCVSCHEDGSVAGSVGAPFDRMGHALRRAVANGGSKMAPVSSRSCLGCHRDITDRIISPRGRGIRVSHRAPLAVGMSCDDCHLGTGHSSGSGRPVEMSRCSGCHDGHVTSATCATCHTQDPRSTPRPSPTSLTYKAVPLPRSADCTDCHDETSCDACHGIRLPHSAEFTAWSHARSAAFGGRALCLRCHTTAGCQKCHNGMNASTVDAHPADWRTSHRTQPSTSACECHWNRLPSAGRATGAYCTVCH